MNLILKRYKGNIGRFFINRELYLDNITSIELRIQYYSLIAATTTAKMNFIES
jgi:hypothetical protein